MVSLIALFVPLVALWLWHPLWRVHKPWYAGAMGLSVFVGVSPALLIWASRSTSWSYSVIAPMQAVSGGLFAALGMCVLFALLRDVLWLVLRVVGARAGAAALQAPRWSFAALVVSLLLSAYGLVQGLKVPQVHEQTITLPRLPSELDGLRIAVLADIHATRVNNADYVREVVARTNATQPDLIVLPGDMVDGDAPTQAGNIAPLADLHAPYGVWASPGNHEYYSGYNAWAKVYGALRLNFLANTVRVLEVRGKRLAISGVGDPAYGRLSQQNTDPTQPEGVPPDIDQVRQQLHHAGGADVHILLGHQPKMARSYAPHGVDLQIAGHTHGGHIVGMDRWLVAPANDGFVRGLYSVGPMQLFVSSGAGLWPGFALRIGVPSSIDVLVLRSGA